MSSNTNSSARRHANGDAWGSLDIDSTRGLVGFDFVMTVIVGFSGRIWRKSLRCGVRGEVHQIFGDFYAFVQALQMFVHGTEIGRSRN